jgi:ankyrin repeat protein
MRQEQTTAAMQQAGDKVASRWKKLTIGIKEDSSYQDYEGLYNAISDDCVLRRLFSVSVPIMVADQILVDRVPLLVEFASHGFWPEIETLLERGANPFVQNTSGETVLSYAVTWGDSRAVVAILRAAPSLGQLNFHGNSLILREIIAVGTADMFSAYLQYSPQVELGALMRTCIEIGRIDLVRYLVRVKQLDARVNSLAIGLLQQYDALLRVGKEP